DFNNDGWPDILQVDMMPEELSERKRMSGQNTYNLQLNNVRRGFHYQYPLNTLQLSNGIEPDGNLIFSEIARQAGVAYTHWSWSSLFVDFDNDGRKDILITNGYPKAVNDFDYMSDMSNARGSGDSGQELRILKKLHSFEVPNYIFRNKGELSFSDQSASWGLHDSGYSYGAAYADLNNNGRLDLVIHNINSPADVYENTGADENTSHFLQVRLKGEPPNTQGIGSEVVLTSGGTKQHLYHNPYRGYQSSVDNRLHFGLPDSAGVDSLEIFWPDGRYQLFTGIPSDQLVTVNQEEANEFRKKHHPVALPDKKFQPVEPDQGINWKHQENDYFVDFSAQPLLPHQLSRLGPALATADVTDDGLDDVYVGGAAGQPGALFIQQSDGSFQESSRFQPWETDRAHEDVDALFFDANGNGRTDLYVVSGGNEHSHVSQLLQDRLYINQGNGRFLKDESALPQMITSGSTVTAGDFTGNGLLDLFVGGRLVPRNYPSNPRSYLLRNEGGRFTDVTEQTTPDLAEPGMITDAVWMDFDGDGLLDLVTAGIWLPIQFYRNNGDELYDVTDSMGLEAHRGWWFSLAKADLNQDGKTDLVAGNLGLNHTFTTSQENPFGVYASDFNKNGQTDLFFTQQIDGQEYPFFGLAKIGRVIEQVTHNYRSFEAFSDAPIREILNAGELNNAIHYQADTFASMYLLNNGNGTFTSRELPAQAQISPLNSILVHDVEENGTPDLILAGNLYMTDPEIPRADAGNGLWLKGSGHGEFKPVSPFESGFLASKDVKSMALIHTPNGFKVIVANNNDLLQMYLIKPDNEGKR
ncbi:MAG: VCBS repeat-containing protein, partial [Balneolales bacterium]